MHVQVDFNAKNDYDMINNYKVLQDVFNKLGVEKVGYGCTALSTPAAMYGLSLAEHWPAHT
jgi:hypothetical protein